MPGGKLSKKAALLRHELLLGLSCSGDLEDAHICHFGLTRMAARRRDLCLTRDAMRSLRASPGSKGHLAPQPQPPRGTRGPVRVETASTPGSPWDHAAQLLLKLSGQGSQPGTGLSSLWSCTAQTHVRGAEARLAMRLPTGTGDFASRIPKVQLWRSPGWFPSSLSSPPAGINTLPSLFTPPKALGGEGFARCRVSLCFCCTCL